MEKLTTSRADFVAANLGPRELKIDNHVKLLAAKGICHALAR
jgi:hypothetical protein